MLGGAKWQCCQFHLAQNAIHHVPNVAIRKRIGTERRAVWNSSDLTKAEVVLVEIDKRWAAYTKAYIKWECQDA